MASSILRNCLTKTNLISANKSLKKINYGFCHNYRLMSSGTYQNILVETKGEKNDVGFIRLNRPKALNALCGALMSELADAIKKFDENDTIGAVVITGNERAFAAGADIKEMKDTTYAQCITSNFLNEWDAISKAQKPLIAAVQGYALGGGCEVAMMCDIIYAAESAKFGQPEILIGTIPGAGGTQRLTKLVGKSRAMEIVLSGNQITAAEADKWGLVSRVFPNDKVVDEAIKLGEKISANSKLITIICKKAVLHSFDTTLTEGMAVEKHLFHSTFATNDRKEGMAAFVEKRPPKFTKS